MQAMTVLGPVDAKDLGVVLPHEHILIDLRHHAFAVEAILDDPELAVDELQGFRAAGGQEACGRTARRAAGLFAWLTLADRCAGAPRAQRARSRRPRHP